MTLEQSPSVATVRAPPRPVLKAKLANKPMPLTALRAAADGQGAQQARPSRMRLAAADIPELGTRHDTPRAWMKSP